MKFKIARDINGLSLQSEIAKLKKNNSELELLNALESLCRMPIEKIGKKEYSINSLDKFKFLIEVENYEIIARWAQYLAFKIPQNKPFFLKSCVNAYLALYESSNNIKYLLHALNMVKMCKGIFKENLIKIYNFTKKVILNSDTPFHQLSLLKILKSIYSKDLIDDFNEFLHKQIGYHEGKKQLYNSGVELSGDVDY